MKLFAFVISLLLFGVSFGSQKEEYSSDGIADGLDFVSNVFDLKVLQWKKYKEQCPPKCYCNNQGFVNCSRLHLTEVPELPTQTTNVDLSVNDFHSLPDDSFAGLPNLNQVDLSENHFDDGGLSEHCFRSASHLSTLYIGANKLTKIPKNLPQNIRLLSIAVGQITSIDLQKNTYLNLSILQLQYNKIKMLPINLATNAPNLIELDVSFNNLTDSSFQAATFKGLTKLEILNFRFNKLTILPQNIPNSLQDLDLVGNPIKVLHSHAFIHLPKLIDISIWESSLTTIEDFAFQGLSQLIMLELNDCHISSNLTNNTLDGLSDVEVVDLSFSNISNLEVGAFSELSKLENLWLNDNPFHTLPDGLFSKSFIPSISTIYLWGNKWKCDCNLKWLKIYQESSSIIQDPHLMQCKEPTKLAGKTWDTIKSDQFVCV